MNIRMLDSVKKFNLQSFYDVRKLLEVKEFCLSIFGHFLHIVGHFQVYNTERYKINNFWG